MNLSSIKFKNILLRFLPYYFLFLIIFCVFGKTLVLPPDQLLSYGDIERSHYYFQTFVKESLQDRELPFWNPYVFSGYPFLANPSVNMFYPPNWLLYAFPLNRAFVWHFAFHMFWASAGMYWLLKKFTHPIPALIGALAFGLSGRFSSNLFAGAYDVSASTSWLPWTIGAICLAVQAGKPRKICMAIIMVFFQILSGYQTMTIFTIQAAALIVLFISFYQKSVKPIAYFACILAAAIGLAGFQLLPMQEMITHSIRSYEKPYTWHMFGPIRPDNLLTLWNPFAKGDRDAYTVNGVHIWEHAFYVGKVPLLLSLAGIISIGVSVIRRKRMLQILLPLSALVIAVGGFWISLGQFAPVNIMDLLFKFIPWYQFLRIPARHLLYPAFGLSVLAAFGAELLYTLHKKAVIPITILLFLTGIDLLIFARIFIYVHPFPDYSKDPLITLVKNSQIQPNERIHPAYISGLDKYFAVALAAPMKYRLFSYDGYDLVVLHNYYQFINASNNVDDIFTADLSTPLLSLSSPAINFLNIRYIITSRSQDPLLYRDAPGLTEEYITSDTKTVVYRNKNTLPRFYIVPHAIVTGSRSTAYQLILNNKIDYARQVLLISDKANEIEKPTCEKPYNSDITAVSYKRNSITLNTSVPCSGYLVTSEAMYPGWEAFVDGKKADILEGNMAFRTIFLSSGNHTVEMKYTPYTFIYGCILSFVTLSVVLFLLFVPRKPFAIRRRN